jgi:hypothetical protein
VPCFFVYDRDYYQPTPRALAAHATQFRPATSDAVATRLTAASFRQLVESRDAQFGALADVAFAEGIVIKQPIVLPDLFRHRQA